MKNISFNKKKNHFGKNYHNKIFSTRIGYLSLPKPRKGRYLSHNSLISLALDLHKPRTAQACGTIETLKSNKSSPEPLCSIIFHCINAKKV